MSDDYLWDRTGPRDPDIVTLEGVLAPLRQADPPPPLRLPRNPERRVSASFVVAFAAMAAMVAMCVTAAWQFGRDLGPAFEVTRISGTPMIAAETIRDRAALRVGGWLETNGDGRATIDVADIGRVEVEPGTRLGLVRSTRGEHRLRLQRGTMHALIWAPPGQFFVETPTATAVDLGCAYTMTVDDNGEGTVRVTSGWVGFEWHGRDSFIPEGGIVVTRPTLGPGTPHYEDTSDGFKAALAAIDLQRGSTRERAAALDLVLAEAREIDRLTLWHLLARVDGPSLDRVFDRLAQFVPPPDIVTREGIRSGRRDMFDAWWDRLGLGTASWWRVWRQPWRDDAAGK